MKLLLFERENRKLVQGIVVEKRPGTGSAAGRVVNIKIKANEYDPTTKQEKEATMQIAFWNSESKSLADDANNRLEVGKYVSGLVSEKDGKYSATAFKKRGVWNFQETYDNAGNVEQPEANVLIGLVVNGYDSEDGKRYGISMPITTYDADNNPTSTWISITFFASERNPNLPANAKKVLHPYTPEGAEKPIRHNAAIRCGKCTPWTPNGKEEGEDTRLTYVAYSFDRID